MISFSMLFLSKIIRNRDLKETDIHFSIEQVQSRSTNSETFDAADGLKSLIKNGTSFIGKVRNKKSINSGKKRI